MRASHLRSDLSRVLIVIEAGTWIYGRSSSSVTVLRVGMNLEAQRHCARYVRSDTCRVGPSAKWSIAQLVIKGETFRPALRLVLIGNTGSGHPPCGKRLSACVPASIGSSMRHPSFARGACRGKKPRPFAIRSQAWSGTGLLALICLYMGTCCRCAEQSPSATVSAMAMRRPFAASGACAARVWCAIRARSICVHRLRG